MRTHPAKHQARYQIRVTRVLGRSVALCVAAVALLCGVSSAQEERGVLGVFDAQSDIGTVAPAGTGRYDPASHSYTLTAAGANTWYRTDDFHYLWKRAYGDLALTADVSFPAHTYAQQPNPHRKGLLMFRQSLEPGAAYVDAAVHGSGMTALQYRAERGANTQDIEINIPLPATVRLEKRGDSFTLFLAMKGERLHQVGATTQLHLKEPFYVGIGALSHDTAITDKVEFARVSLQALAAPPPEDKRALYSTLQTIQIDDQFRRAMMLRTGREYLQSPGWAPSGTSDTSGRSVYVHQDGHIVRIPVSTSGEAGAPQALDVGPLTGCSGNFGPSPDGRWIAVSCAERAGASHQVYLLPAAGGAPQKLTQGPASSFFHAWAPDSQSVAFTRGSAGKADIFTISVSAGAETRLTSDTLNDGPDYTADGKLIYFDSARSGRTQIWRMKADGSAAEQVTDDERLNSSPHVSPDGKTVAFLSQPVDTGVAGPGVGEAPLRTLLKTYSPGDGLIRTIVAFQGDRGSLAMNSWVDAKHLSFVSYQQLPEGAPVAAAHAARPPITGVSHIALYAADAARSERFYVHDLGAVKRGDPENLKGTRYYFSPLQFVEILPLNNGTNGANGSNGSGGPASINRLDHVAFTTTDVERLRRYLAAQQIAVPKHTAHGADGSQWLDVTDPEGNKIEFVQAPEHLPEIAANALSRHIIHVGFIVHDRQREDAFFRTVLGFKPYWFGGMKDDVPTWISQQVPDGHDWLEYMLVSGPEDHGIPANMKAADLGVLNHFSLGVRSTADAYTLLWNGDRLAGQTNVPKIGRDAKWQLNLLDPDGTRAELMELHAIGKPCCSPFTAADPEN